MLKCSASRLCENYRTANTSASESRNRESSIGLLPTHFFKVNLKLLSNAGFKRVIWTQATLQGSKRIYDVLNIPFVLHSGSLL